MVLGVRKEFSPFYFIGLDMSTLVFDNTSRIMVVAPHPDDETIATGGLLQQAVDAGAAVRIIFITSGENNPWAQRFFEYRWHIGEEDCVRFGRLRKLEAIAALRTLGIDTDDAIFLGFPDQGITQLLLKNDPKIIQCLTDEIARWQPTFLVGPSSLDLHPDHSAAAVLIDIVLDRLKHCSRPKRVEYRVHAREKKQRTLEQFSSPLTDRQQEIKRQAILCHVSQVKLQRRKLLAKAQSHEEFLCVSETPSNFCGYHPVRNAQYHDDNLELELSLKPHLGAFGQPSIHLVSWDDNQRNTSLVILFADSLPISKGFRQVKIQDYLTGSIVAGGSYHGNYRGGILRLPLANIVVCGRLFSKLERRFGFFDEAGWRELPVAQKSDLKKEMFE
jgi:LmbE family N-acetylglucosaminyl deacetylase